MRVALRSAASLVPIVLAIVLSACSRNGAEPLALTEIEPGVLELTTTCADGLSADVEETIEEVRIRESEASSSMAIAPACSRSGSTRRWTVER